MNRYNFKTIEDKWRKKFKQSKSDLHYMKFSKARSELKKLRKEKMNANFEDETNPNLVNKKFFSHVRSKSNSSRIPESIYYQDHIRSKPVDQAFLFNEFFADQFSSPSLYNIEIDYSVDYNIVFDTHCGNTP